MSEYTTEDFEQARFAEHPDGRLAHRVPPGMNDGWEWSLETPSGERDRAGTEALIYLGWSPVRESAHVSPETLRAEWESAEVPTSETPISEGDICIEQIREGSYAVMTAQSCGYAGRAFRVLSRAPQPKPWQGLAEVLEDYYCRPIMPRGEVDEVGEFEAQRAAEWMYGRGIRLTGDAE